VLALQITVLEVLAPMALMICRLALKDSNRRMGLAVAVAVAAMAMTVLTVISLVVVPRSRMTHLVVDCNKVTKD